MFSSPTMDTSFGRNDSVFGNNLTNTEESEAQRGPILFGNKRRSMAVTRTPSFMNSGNAAQNIISPSTDIFSSPAVPSAIPSHIKEATQGSGKSVHWSPSLVSDKNLSSPLVKPHSQGLTNISNAPPLRSLRDETEPVKKTARRSICPTVSHSLNQSTHSAIASQNQDSSTVSSPQSSAENWVTVFGFTPDQVYNVLQFFSRHGEVIQHKVPTKGNWMHIAYSCGIHAKQALARNGAVLDGCTRIGVIPCTEKELAGGDAPPMPMMNRSLMMEQSIREEPAEENTPAVTIIDQNNSALENSLNSSRMSMASRAGMRSLSTSYRPRPDSKLEDPVKQDSFMNKLWSAVGF